MNIKNGFEEDKDFQKKLDVIDLSIGNPDMPTPSHVVDCLCDTVKHHPRTHGYPQAKGMPKFRKAVAGWMGRRFGVDLDFNSEILALIGSKEGIAHLCMAYLNPGDYVLVCDPAYPAHFNGVILAGGSHLLRQTRRQVLGLLQPYHRHRLERIFQKYR